ncbi:NAD(P)-dependent malic enzyme [Allobaculum stercoricanis]|uniref:NAD(P)-dependent malic enzyme n=1 Tax=Allobaculum stercoricanis TaxID=174709 RepID=UPI00248E7DCB|nr:NADP-dependent malic enzyme [Allobaculum stercoricanis]
MDYAKLALDAHAKWQGKIDIVSKPVLKTASDLAVAYTPGVAAPCLEIAKDPETSFTYTGRSNLIAVVSDGSAVLGLGNIGGLAGLPVMEGKCVLFKELGGVNAIPIVLNVQEVDQIVDAIAAMEPSFGGINLEDIAAPKCFEVEHKLQERMNIPVFHDDQHGTACVVLAALINALKLTHKTKEEAKVVFSGAGAAGCAIAKLLADYGFKNIRQCDLQGMITPENAANEMQKELALRLNPNGETGTLKTALKNSDIFIGVSKGGLVDEEMIASMNQDAIVFAMANPIPEISPELAKKAGARVVGCGRSDFPNQINNVLIFPALFRGVLDAKATRITESMKLAASEALASLITEEELTDDYVIVDALDPRVKDVVSKAVAKAAQEEGVIRA